MSPSATGETGTEAVAGVDGEAVVTAEPPPLAQPVSTQAATTALNSFLSITSPLSRIANSMSTTQTNTVPAVGQQAPDFTLKSTSGEKITLSALRGKPVLIAFFPLAFTSTCTAEL